MSEMFIGQLDRPTDRERLTSAVKEFRALGYDAIRFSCYSEEEAHELRTWAKSKWPEAPIFFSWMTFK